MENELGRAVLLLLLDFLFLLPVVVAAVVVVLESFGLFGEVAVDGNFLGLDDASPFVLAAVFVVAFGVLRDDPVDLRGAKKAPRVS